jgi:hypothetical protein
MKEVATFAILLLFLFMTSVVGLANTEPTLLRIRINSDGSINPDSAPIRRSGDVYTFRDNIYGQIVVDRDNVVIEGAGYALEGNYNGTRTDSWIVGQGPDQGYENTELPWTIGIDLANENRSNLTVKNLNIKNFYIGIYVWTSNNIITNCAVSDNIVGILLSGDSNNIISNYIANNEEGIFFGVNNPGDEPLNIVLTRNSFIDNDVHFSGCFCEDYNTTEAVHTWDDGKEGNYWCDYKGTDQNGDGVGDVPYVIDVQNKDRYPLMQMAATPPIAPQSLPVEALIIALLLPIIIAVAAVAYKKKK